LEDRATLVIPAERVGSLDIPPLALDTGGADPEWVDWPLRGGRVLRLPLSPKLARRVAWRIPLRWYLSAGSLITLLGYLAVPVFLPATGTTWLWAQFALLCTAITLTRMSAGVILKQVPLRSWGGRLRLREVPVEVARSWAAANPGVVVKERPAHGTVFPPGVLPVDRS
jgi:hypothetical protein